MTDEPETVDFVLERAAAPVERPKIGDEIPFCAPDGTVLVDDETGEITTSPSWIAPEPIWREHVPHAYVARMQNDVDPRIEPPRCPACGVIDDGTVAHDGHAHDEYDGEVVEQ